jgi:hypothetical protein
LTTNVTNVPDQFKAELCEAFIAANIPFGKLANQKLKCFLEKYCNKNIPHPSSLGRDYLQMVYKQVLKNKKK